MKIVSVKIGEERSENTNGNEMIYDNYGNICNSCTICIVLFLIAFLIMIGISSAFIYFGGYLTNSNIGVININPGTGTIIY